MLLPENSLQHRLEAEKDQKDKYEQPEIPESKQELEHSYNPLCS